MKRFYFSIVLLAIIIASSVWSTQKLDRLFDSLTSEIQNAVTFFEKGRFDDAYEAAEKVCKDWDKNKTFLGAMLNHNELSDTDINVFELEHRLKSDDTDEINTLCFTLHSKLHSMRDSGSMTLANLL